MRSAFAILRGAGLTGAVALALPCAGAVAASTGTGENTPVHLSSTSVHHASVGGGSILRTIIALAIVIGLIYAVARVLKAVKRGSSGGQASGEGLEHLATLPLQQGRSVALVRSGSDVVLVGVSEHGVTPIKVYTQAEALLNGITVDATDATAARSSARSPADGWLDVLRRMTVRV